jgi:hypothetical protein
MSNRYFLNEKANRCTNFIFFQITNTICDTNEGIRGKKQSFQITCINKVFNSKIKMNHG